LDISHVIDAEGADYGDAEIAQYLADQARGSTPVDFRVPNRQIVLPLNLRLVGGVSHDTMRSNLQKKVARIQQEGGWIRRTTTSGTLFADVVNASLSFGGSWMQSRVNNRVDTEAELRLECIPDWYGPEVTLPVRTSVDQSELIWTETGILGDWPGRVRIVVDESEGQAQQGLLWGVRSRHYSSSTTAQLRYAASSCTPLDTAAIAGETIAHSSLATNWTPLMSTDQSGGVALTHTGTYRVVARLSSATIIGSTPPPLGFRLLWDVGDFSLPTENPPVSVPQDGSFYIRDLGEVRLDRTPSGTHRWRGVVQARGPAGGEFGRIHRFWFVPVDEGAGKLRAPLNVDPGLSTYTARDEFNQTAFNAGVLTGKSLPVGGVWQGDGDTDDVTVNAGVHIATRPAVSDPGVYGGRFMTAGITNYTATVVQVDFFRGSYSGQNGISGVLARYLSPTQFLVAGATGTAPDTSAFAAFANGTATTLGAKKLVFRDAQWYTVRLFVDTAGRYVVWLYPQGGTPGQPVLSGVDPVLATGGALQTGRVGFYDSCPTGPGSAGPGGLGAPIRNYDNFAAWAPQTDAVLFPNQSAELRTEGMFREDPTGAAFGPVTDVTGDLPRIPPSGTEGRSCQVFIHTSRGDIDTQEDGNADNLSARLIYRPSHILTT